MAEQLILVRTYDFASSDVDSVDLLPYVKIPDGWIQQPGDGITNVDEAITLNIDADSQDALAVFLQSIDEKIVQIGWAQNPIEQNGVWLRAQLSAETGTRQAYLMKGRRGGLHAMLNTIESGAAYQYILGLTRRPYWENDDYTLIEGTGVSCLGGTVSYTLYGDEPARAARLRIQPIRSGGSTRYLDEFWIGCKTNRIGDIAHFQPIWDLTQAGILGTDTTSDGSVLTCTFGTSSALVARATISVANVISDFNYYPSQQGEYLVLVRAYVTGSLVANIRVGVGYYGQSVFNVGNREAVSATAATLHPTSIISIPPNFAGNYTPGQVAIRIEAEKVSGSGNLIMDRIVLIPTLEGALHGKSATAALNNLTLTQYLETYQRPDGSLVGDVYSALSDNRLICGFDPDQIEWGIAPGSGILVVAAQGPATAASTFNLELKAYEAWRTLRGAET